MFDILIRKAYSKFDHLARSRAKGRSSGKPVGSHIMDLADLKKSIVLCPSCVSGFNPKAHHYVKWTKTDYICGNCDACKNHSSQAFMFLHESNYY